MSVLPRAAWTEHEAVCRCCHKASGAAGGTVVITIGNSLRGDDGIAKVVCDALPELANGSVCRFDLGLYTNFLVACMAGHKAAVIVDATHNGSEPGDVTTLDLREAIGGDARALKLASCHGLSVIDELKIAAQRGYLPEQVTFFGIEVDAVDGGQGLSEALAGKVPELADKLKHCLKG